jgi:nucleoside phosphorylase
MLVKTGMGLLKTRKAFEAIINHGYNILQVINIGIAGALNPSYSIGSVSLVTKVINEDDRRNYLLQPPILKEYSASNLKKQNFDISKITLHENAVLVSVKNPVGSSVRKSFYRKTFHADIVDMEATAIAAICMNQDIKYYIIKGISDSADESTMIPENIINDSGKFIYKKLIVYFIKNPVTMLKAFYKMYKNCRYAMENAVAILYRILF